MEGKLSQGNLIQGGTSFGSFGLQGSIQVHQTLPRQGCSVHSSVGDVFHLTTGTLQNCDRMILMTDFSIGDRSRNSASEEVEPSFTEDGRGEKGLPWQRVKWTDKMVKLLITAVSYIGENGSSDGNSIGRRKFVFLQKKGKWKSIAKVMAERAYHISPQQCEDKFNDINKRYKKLNDILGRGTSCQVVENPALLDLIDYLTEKQKDDVRKILSSKHLFYEEMCSYHNSNRLHLPHDPALQCSLQLALRNTHDYDNDDTRRTHHDEDDEVEENYASHGDNRGIYEPLEGSMKTKLNQCQGHKDASALNSLTCQDHNKHAYTNGEMVESDTNQVLSARSQKLELQSEMLELQKQRFKWQRFSKKKDQEPEKLRLENDRMRLENEHISLELKQKEMGAFN